MGTSVYMYMSFVGNRKRVAVTMHLKVKHKASLHISFNLETKSLLQLHVGVETLKLRVCLFSFSSIAN